MKNKDGRNYCRRCRSEIPEGMAFCPHCMEKIEDNGGKILLESRYKPAVNKWFAAVVITILCIILAMLTTVFFMSANQDKKEEYSFPESSLTAQETTVQTTGTTEVTEPLTEEMPTIQVPQADFESMIRNGFDSWTGLGDSGTLSFDGYSCTFSCILMNEHISCELVSAKDFSSYVLTMSADEYSTGAFAEGIEKHIRAFAEIVLGYKPLYMGDNIRSAVRDMLSGRETTCHITEKNFNCYVEYDSDTYTATITAELT